MKRLELSDEQSGWVHSTDPKEAYMDANLPTDPEAGPGGESETDGEGDE